MPSCPKCQRTFDDAGFCPFDGAALGNSEGSQASGAPPGDSDHLSTAAYDAQLDPGESAVARVLGGVLEERKRRDALVGAILDDRYKIERLIGEGGMGMVYLARHTVIEKLVAIKVLRAEIAADESVVRRFVQEARAASRIGHPNIIDVTDFGTTSDGLTYQVMEYLEGQTLSEALQDVSTMAVKDALPIIAQMARALGAAHAKGIVHRDLKPDNVFLMRRDGRSNFVKIVDFGIAKVQPTDEKANQPRLTRVGTVFGTPEYMAPEQAAGRTDVDLRADIYALATILYEMLVGRVPHRGETTVRTLAMQMLDAPKPMREFNPALEIEQDFENVVMQALSKKRESRYPDMASFLRALEEVTSATELDLPKLVDQERQSAQMVSHHDFDTIPEADLEKRISASLDEATRDRATAAVGKGKAPRGRATDPVFLQRKGESSLPLVETLDVQASTQFHSTQGRNRTLLIAVALLFVGGISAFAFMREGTTGNSSVNAGAASDAGSISKDGAIAILGQDDAASSTHDSLDGGQEEGPTGGNTESSADKTLDAGLKGHRPGWKKKPNPNLLPSDTEIEIRVHTSPPGGKLWVVGGSYAGSDGTNLKRLLNSTMKLRCTKDGYRAGFVKVVFAPEPGIFRCSMRKLRKSKCVPGLKGFDDECP